MASEKSKDEPPSPLEIIFSCAICQTTLTDLHRRNERYDVDPDPKWPANQLWLTQCCHVLCSEHFDEGVLPLHPESQNPRAPCPKCADENQDIEEKELYGIYGFEDGQFDPKIPKTWFQCPPIRLHDEDEGIKAVRFQYLALLKFASTESVRRRQAEVNLQDSKKDIADSRLELSNANDKLRDFQIAVLEKEKYKRQLKMWKDKERAIHHYLGLVPELASEIEELRARLLALGCTLPHKSYALGQYGKLKQPQIQTQGGDDRRNQLDQSSLTRGASVALDEGQERDHNLSPSSTRTLSKPTPQVFQQQNGEPSSSLHDENGKIQYEAHEHGKSTGSTSLSPLKRSRSSELMPPPALPMLRTLESGSNGRLLDETTSQFHMQKRRELRGAELLREASRSSTPGSDRHFYKDEWYIDLTGEDPPEIDRSSSTKKQSRYVDEGNFHALRSPSARVEEDLGEQRHEQGNRSPLKRRRDEDSHDIVPPLGPLSSSTRPQDEFDRGSRRGSSWSQNSRWPDSGLWTNTSTQRRVRNLQEQPLTYYRGTDDGAGNTFDRRADPGYLYQHSPSTTASSPTRPSQSPAPRFIKRPEDYSVASPFFPPRPAQQYESVQPRFRPSTATSVKSFQDQTARYRFQPTPRPSYAQTTYNSPTPLSDVMRTPDPKRRRTLLAPSTPRNSDGLFQRPVAPTAPLFRGTAFVEPITFTSRPTHSRPVEQPHHNSATYEWYSRPPTPRREHTAQSLPLFAPVNSSGTRSGVSRPSLEYARDGYRSSAPDVFSPNWRPRAQR